MAFDCTKCGYRSNEVKAGGGVPARGQTFTLTVQGPEDLCRDVLKVRNMVHDEGQIEPNLDPLILLPSFLLAVVVG